MSQDTDQPPVQRQLSHGMIAELFTRHHGSFEQMLAALASDLKAYIHQEIKTVSETLHTDVVALKAAMSGLTQEVSDGLAANAAAIQALKDQIASGGTVATADLADIEATTAAAVTATDALKAALNPEPPPAPAP